MRVGNFFAMAMVDIIMEMVIRHGQNWPSSVCERSLFLHATFKFIMKKIARILTCSIRSAAVPVPTRPSVWRPDRFGQW